MKQDRGESEPVAPGYPAVESLGDLDVSEWEPAVVFRPVELAAPNLSEEADR